MFEDVFVRIKYSMKKRSIPNKILISTQINIINS